MSPAIATVSWRLLATSDKYMSAAPEKAPNTLGSKRADGLRK